MARLWRQMVSRLFVADGSREELVNPELVGFQVRPDRYPLPPDRYPLPEVGYAYYIHLG